MLKFRMSKEKPVTSGSSMRGRYSYKISRTLSAGIGDVPIEKAVPTKRVCLGGRGREWAAESLKLLETMSVSDDAKLFLEPMNPLRYPEYYNIVRDPIDLSKIMLKFHGGSYPGLYHFSEDMNLMFDNYKKFFKDSSTEAYHQVRRLGSWFDTELDKIKTRWYRICDNGSRVVTGVTNGYTPRPGSLDARIQAIEAENRRIVNLAAKPPSSVPIRLAPVDQRQVKLPRMLNAVSLSSKTGAGPGQGPMNRTPVLAFRLAPDGAVTSSSSSLKLSGSGNSQPIIIMSKSSGENGSPSTQAGLMYMCAGWPKQSVLKPVGSVGAGAMLATRTTGTPRPMGQMLGSILPRAVPPSAMSPNSSSEGDGLMLDVGNVWFGTAMNQPIEPVTIDEKGLHFLLKNGEQETPFTIGCDEVIKCAAYFGNIRKHTLFLFVLPNCVRRLCSLGEEFTLSSLIIMFPRALSQSQIAKLVYLFWRMSRVSMFGDLFCEIDQKSALALLGNIRPTAVSNMASKYNDALGSASSALKRGVIGRCVPQNGAGDGVSVLNDPANVQFICDTAEAFEVDCKLEPVDEEPEEVLSAHKVGSNLIDLGLSSIVDNKCLKLAENLLANEALKDIPKAAVDGGSKSDVIRKRLKIRYRPGILKHAKKRKTEEKHHSPLQLNEEEEDIDEEASSEQHPRDEECDNQFTIIEWFPDDNALPAEHEEDESVASDNSQNNELHRIPGCKEEIDLEIVAPANDSDAEMDIGVSCNTSVVGENGEVPEELVITGEEDLVMTGEKINIRCPITQQIMEYPVKNIHCSHLYDKQGVENLIKNRGDKAKCPVTGCSNALPLQMQDVQHDSQLSFYIQQKLSQAASR